MQRHHCIISGTGRAGTTFIVQLLTRLGLDTGFTDPDADVSPLSNAGLERDLHDKDAPYIIKSPWICDYLDEVLARGGIVIDHAIVPIRDLFQAAQSRREVVARAGAIANPRAVRGGLWHTSNPASQELALTLELYKLMRTLAKYDIPTTTLDFPRFVHDAHYLYGKLAPILQGVDIARFLEAFRATVRPELVHQFAPPPHMLKSTG
jgi:hypothetical protein